MTPEDEEFEAISRRQLADLNRNMRSITEDAVVRTVEKLSASWNEAFSGAIENALLHGTGFIKVTTNGPDGLTLSVVKPEEYRYVMEDPAKPQEKKDWTS